MRPVILLLSALGLVPLSGALAGERLLVPQLDNWRPVVGHAGPAGEVTEMIPQHESPEAWTRRMTVQAFRGINLPVAEFLDKAAEGVADSCDFPMIEPSRLGRLEGAEAGSRLVACGRNSGGSGEVSLFYAIGGREAFYVISRSWRGAAFDSAPHPVPHSEMDEWIGFMRAVRLGGS